MEKVNVYIDGPNLLGAVSEIRKKRVWVDPYQLAQRLIRPQEQHVQRIYYAETPYHANLHNPEVFRRQQSFFGNIHKYIVQGTIVHIRGVYRIEDERVPFFILKGLDEKIRLIVQSLIWKRPIEKGGDVGLAVQMVRDACLGEYDRALLVTADQDYTLAVNTVLNDLKKQVSICYVQNTYRNAMALRNRCGNPPFVQVTRAMIDACEMK